MPGANFDEGRLFLTSDIKPLFEALQTGCSFYSQPVTNLIEQLEIEQLEDISELTVEPNFEPSQILARTITYIPIGTLDIAEKTRFQMTPRTSTETVFWSKSTLFNYLEEY
jgi:hypothetical protein